MLEEVPLIDRVRVANIERNREYLRSLGLDDPLIPKPHKPRKPPKPLVAAKPTRRAPLRGQANAIVDELSGHRLGFDFGYAHALL